METEERPVGMTAAEYALRVEGYRLVTKQKTTPDPDYLARALAITGFPGHYGLAGFVITINGSPTRLVLVVVGRTRSAAAIYLLRERPVTIASGWDRPTPKGRQPLEAAVWQLLEERGYVDDQGYLRAPGEAEEVA